MADYDATDVLTGDIGAFQTNLEDLATIKQETNDTSNTSHNTTSFATMGSVTLSVASDEVALVICKFCVSGGTASDVWFIAPRAGTTALATSMYWTVRDANTAGTETTLTCSFWVRGDDSNFIAASSVVNIAAARSSGSGTIYSARRTWSAGVFKVRT